MTDLPPNDRSNGMPRAVLIFAAVLIASDRGAWSARMTGFGRVRRPRRAGPELALRFDDQDDGRSLVRRAGDGATIYRVAPETNGFIRDAAARPCARTPRAGRRRRNARSFSPAGPTARSSLDDPTTGRRVELEAFGHTNAGAFAQLFQASGAAQ